MNVRPMKPGWKVWRFDQIATNVNVRIDNPSESGMEHYVGLEHLDPDSLRIRRWGSPDDVEATKLMFKKGDIIFGRRRAYQRKLGVAEFDGICSAHAMVLRAKPDVVLPEFLPFFMQSDLFMNRAVEISVGSLSPTINWKTLAVQEFALPPIQGQEQIVDLLMAAHHVIDNYVQAVLAGDRLLQSRIDAAFSSQERQKTCLQDVCKLPITYGIVQAGPHVENGVPYIRVSDMTRGERLSAEGMLRTSTEIAKKYCRSSVFAGDIVFALRGDVGLCRVVPQELDGSNLTQGTARISVSDDFDQDYVYWSLFSTRVKQQISKVVKGSTFKEITLASLRSLEINLEPKDVQREISKQLEETAAAVAKIKRRHHQALDVYKQIQSCMSR